MIEPELSDQIKYIGPINDRKKIYYLEVRPRYLCLLSGMNHLEFLWLRH
jgi:hypothetical protein